MSRPGRRPRSPTPMVCRPRVHRGIGSTCGGRGHVPGGPPGGRPGDRAAPGGQAAAHRGGASADPVPEGSRSLGNAGRSMIHFFSRIPQFLPFCFLGGGVISFSPATRDEQSGASPPCDAFHLPKGCTSCRFLVVLNILRTIVCSIDPHNYPTKPDAQLSKRSMGIVSHSEGMVIPTRSLQSRANGAGSRHLPAPPPGAEHSRAGSHGDPTVVAGSPPSLRSLQCESCLIVQPHFGDATHFGLQPQTTLETQFKTYSVENS